MNIITKNTHNRTFTNNRYITIFFIIFIVFINGCVGGGNSADTEPPVVISFTPHRGQTDVPINTQIVVTFSKSVININSNTFYIEKLSGGKIAASIMYNDSTRTAVLQLLENLDYNSIYYVTLTSEIRSRSGVALIPEAWAFITGIQADTQKPTIIEKSPAYEYYVNLSTPIYIVFSEPVINVNSTTVFIKKGNDILQASVAYNETTRKAEITPSQPLEEWTRYTIVLTDSITDLSGNSLDAYQYTFRTDDTTYPSVISKYPEGDEIPTNSLISVTFSESIKSYTITNVNNFKLEKWTGATWENVERIITYNDNTKTAICYSQSGLEPNTEYKVTLKKDIRDQAHNPLNQETTWQFTTKNEPDTTPPQLSSKVPNDNQTNVPTDTVITITFNENVLGVDSTSFVVKRADTNEAVQGTVIYNHNMYQATFTPVFTLAEGVWYKVELSSNIHDTANNMLVPVSWQFKTQDTTKPDITYRYPSNGMGNVGNNVNIVVTFSERVNNVSVQSFKIRNETTGQYIAGNVTYNDATKTATFDPDDPLPFETTFTVVLTNDIKDASDNSLNYTEWSFQTGIEPDTTPPSIVSRYPSSGQTNIPISSTIQIQFSEPVSGVGPQTIQLKKGDQNGIPIPVMVNYDSISQRVNITPLGNLEYESQYTVVVIGGDSSDIKDVAGNRFASTVNWSFATTADTTSPYVTFKSPEQGTPDIPGNAVEVRVLFSEQVMNVNTNTFKLRRVSDNTEISCNVTYSYNPQNNIAQAVLTPLANITVTGTYRAELSSAITDMSVAQNPLQAVQWTFEITAIDETAPTVVLKSPAAGNTNWNNKKVTVIFSEDVKGVSGSSFFIKDQYNTTIPATVTYYPGLLTAELEVLQDLEYEKTFTAYLTNAIKDKANNTLSPISWSFSTPQDSIPPFVSTVYPPDGTTGYPVNGSIWAKFSEPIQGYSSSSFYLDPPVSATIVYDEQTKTLTLIPQSNMQGQTQYTVRITTAIKDRANIPNSLLNDYIWRFTTQYVPDTTPPTIVAGSRFPAPGTVNVPLNSNIRLQFSEAVKNIEKITLKKGTITIPVEISYNPATFTVTLDPIDNLEQNTVYTVTVPGGSTGIVIMDLADNRLASTDTWQFTTELDTTPPSIISRYPVPGAVNVQLKPVITVTFSEPVVNVTTSTFTLSGSGVGTFYVVYDDATRTATLTPGTELSNNTTYTVTLTNGIRDRYNNSLSTTTWTFTTYSLPQITNIEVSNNGGSSYSAITDAATNVNSLLTHVRITFNRSMNTEKQWLQIYEGASGSTTPAPLTPFNYFWDSNNTRITYILKGRCKGGTQYQFKLFGWGGSFEDTDGNRVSRTAYVGDGILNFTTAADSIAPLVIATIPYNSATNVGRDIGFIIIQFNEMMNQSRDSRITLSPAITATRQGWIEGGRTVIFTIGQLAANTTYSVTLNSGTNSFQDLAGNNAAASGQVICTFTTGTTTGSSTQLSESFENYSQPYFSNFKNISTDNTDWIRITTERSGNGSTLSPPQGSYFAKAASFEYDPGTYSDIVNINSINMSTLGSYILTFQMYHERIYNAPDRIEVLLSTDGINFNPIDTGAMGQVYRYDWSLGNDNPVWQTHYVDLSAFSGPGYNSVWIKLRAYSAGEMGQNIIVDDVRLLKY
ncbi:MAG: Ig-like domain-containing protein [Spirochaetes bacterium]|nr:Ig-like domain-containing protein [Spirochaetota bacterium]